MDDIVAYASTSIFVEFGTGLEEDNRQRDVEEFENDPYYNIDYHRGEVEVTRWRVSVIR